jgi:hypothetical protein
MRSVRVTLADGKLKFNEGEAPATMTPLKDSSPLDKGDDEDAENEARYGPQRKYPGPVMLALTSTLVFVNDVT